MTGKPEVDFPTADQAETRCGVATLVTGLITSLAESNAAKFFDELSRLPSNVPPDPEKVAEIFGRYGMEILAPQPA